MPNSPPLDSSVPYSGATRVVFIVGDPIAQVKAPYGLTRRFRELGADTIVVPALVEAQDFDGFVATAERMGNVVGLIVTVPHKFAAHRLCAEVDPAAERVGSVNLMRRRSGGGWFGSMTDGEGCLAGLRSRGFDPLGKRVLLVGAGGAGVAVADALVRASIAELCVLEFDAGRSTHLIEALGGGTVRTLLASSDDPHGFDLVVNATLLGTSSEDPPPVNLRRLSPKVVVADLACGPGGTSALITAAAASGCVTMSGAEMFEAVCDVLARFFLEIPPGRALAASGTLQAYRPAKAPAEASSPVHVAGSQATDEDSAARLRDLLNGYQATQVIHAAAVLGIADHLSSSPVDVNAVAQAVGANVTALYRLLRALAALGVIREHVGRTFSIAPMGTWLRSDADPSMRDWAIFLAEPVRWRTWGHLVQSIRTGENAFKAIHGTSSWEYRRKHPDQAALFHSAMTANSRRIDRAVVAACDLGDRRHLVDVGGGEGSLLAAFLQDRPGLSGTLFDQPQVVASARSNLDRAGVLHRCRIIGGDMFAEVPRGGDALLLKFILHDWSDDDAVAILRSCRVAVERGAALFVVEYLLEPPNEGLHAKMSDLNMLLGPGGRERTADEYAAILHTAGFSLTSVMPTSAPVSILVATAC